jgi:hypothetical protein
VENWRGSPGSQMLPSKSTKGRLHWSGPRPARSERAGIEGEFKESFGVEEYGGVLGVLLVELKDFAGVAEEAMDQLALVAFVDGPIDLVARKESAAAEVGELVGDRKGGAVGVPGQAGEGEEEVVFGMVEDIGIGGHVTGEAEDGIAVAGEREAALVGQARIEVELDGLAGLKGLAIVVGEFPGYPERAAAFIVSQAAQRNLSSSCFKRGFSG